MQLLLSSNQGNPIKFVIFWWKVAHPSQRYDFYCHSSTQRRSILRELGNPRSRKVKIEDKYGTP